MKIIIFDGTFKTTTFINRLCEGLAKKHEISIIGFNEQVHKKIHNVSYICLGSNNSKIRFLKTSIALRGGNIKQQLNLFSLVCKGKKRKIKEENLQLVVNKMQPDILHFQWVSVLSYLDKLVLPKKTKTVFSQRGFHINVRPFINNENMQFLKGIFPKIDGFHSVSSAIQDKSNKIFSSSYKVDKVVYSGFDFKNLPVKKNQDRGGVLKIISVGRNHWKKDYATAIKSMFLLKKKGLDFVITIVGIEQDEELLFLVNDLGLSENVKFIKKIPQQSVYELMCGSDVLLLSSIEEGIANVCVEAMFCKLPVISTNCGGMEELIRHNETGFITPVRDAKEMAVKLVDFSLKTAQELILITDRAYDFVSKQHSSEKMVNDMDELYNYVHRID